MQQSFYRALNLRERIGASRENRMDPSLAPQRRMRAQNKLVWWTQELKRDQEKLLRWKTQELEIEEAGLQDAIGASDAELAAMSVQPPSWIHSLASALQILEHGNQNRGDTNALGMLSFAWPWIQQVNAHLDRFAERSEDGPLLHMEEIQKAVLRSLIKRFGLISNRTLILELNVARVSGRLPGETSEARFANFSHAMAEPESLLALVEEYPVLARMMTEEASATAMFMTEMLHHLNQDWRDLQSAFFASGSPGACVDISLGAGDRHQGGKTVSILRFEDGSKLLYKPKSLAADALFAELADRLGAAGLRWDLKVPRCLCRDGYGWTEFISYQPCASEQDLERFYIRSGELLALVYCLQAGDLHYENLMAAADYPVPLDFECLFSQFGHQFYEASHSLLSRALTETVLFSGLLPGRPVGGAGGVDLSGLSCIRNVSSPFENVVFDNPGKDQLQVSRRRTEMQETHNSPFPGGSTQTPADYREMVVSGWKSGMTALHSIQKELLSSKLWRNLSQLYFRYVPVHSYQYIRIFRESCHPNVLRDGTDRDAIFDELWNVTPDSPIQVQLVRSARRSLWKGDIPLFHAKPSSTEVWDSFGNCFASAHLSPVIHAVKRKLKTNPDELRHHWTIRQSLKNAFPGAAPALTDWLRSQAKKPLNLEQACALLAESIGDYLLGLACQDSGQVLFTDTLELTSTSKKQHFAGIQDTTVYDGLSGMLIFFHYLAKVSRRAKFSAMAHDILFTIHESLHPGALRAVGLGGFANLGSILYALAHVKHSVEPADGLLEGLQRSIPGDNQFDLISGSAGTICAALSYYLSSGHEGALYIATMAGDHLVQNAISAGPGSGWKNLGNSVPLTGFAHGASGIAYALSRLAQATQKNIYSDFSEQAMRYERSHFSPEIGNWRDLRDWVSNGDSVCWCYGAPGMGLSLLGQRELGFGDETAEREIAWAFAKTLAHPLPAHILCHGALGNWELLDLSADAFANQQWKQKADAYLQRTIYEICEHGVRFDGPGETLNLMLGLAGVGYALLRRAYPGEIPSVLLLESPVGIRARESLVLTGA